MQDRRAFDSAWARFESFRENLPTYAVKEEYVAQYHDLIGELQSALGENLDKFKIPSDQLRPQVASFRMASYSGRPGSVRYSQDKRCEHNYFSMQMDGLWRYLKPVVDAPIKPYTEPDPTRQYLAPLHIGTMIGSSVQQGTHGSTVNVNFQANQSQISNLLETIKSSMDQFPLSQEDKGQLKAEVAMIEAQISSPRRRDSAIKECLQSLSSILASIATSTPAVMTIIHNISKILGS